MEDQSHPTIIAQISDDLNKSLRRVPPPPEGPVGLPEPHDRPDGHAQWDEVNGHWIVWDAQAQAWVVDTNRAAPEPDAASEPDVASEPDPAQPAAGQASEPETGLH